MAKELKLVLKKKWYDMIASGQKKEEYRAITRYWFRRIVEDGAWVSYDSYSYQMSRRKKGPYSEAHGCRHDTVTFYLGYAKDRPSMTFKINDLLMGNIGRPEWGAPANGEYFIIKLGERLMSASPG